MADPVQTTFEKSVDEGERRLTRTLPALAATGFVGGIDVGIGILALLLVRQATGNELLAALAFGIGFVALTLANSELFTENFLVPVAAVAAARADVRSLGRLWAGTAAMNLVGGWVFTGLLVSGFPKVRADAVDVGRHFVDAGIGWTSFSAAVVGGAAITLMTWMERGTDSVPAKLVAVGTAFLLAAGPMDYTIVVSLEMFVLHAGAPFGYADWAGAAAWAALGNVVGGLGLVTLLRLVQVGRDSVEAERRRPKGQDREDDPARDAPSLILPDGVEPQ